MTDEQLADKAQEIGVAIGRLVDERFSSDDRGLVPLAVAFLLGMHEKAMQGSSFDERHHRLKALLLQAIAQTGN